MMSNRSKSADTSRSAIRHAVTLEGIRRTAQRCEPLRRRAASLPSCVHMLAQPGPLGSGRMRKACNSSDVYGCCRECYTLLVQAVQKTEPEYYIRVNHEQLQRSARDCELCSYFLWMLGGPDGRVAQLSRLSPSEPDHLRLKDSKMPYNANIDYVGVDTTEVGFCARVKSESDLSGSSHLLVTMTVRTQTAGAVTELQSEFYLPIFATPGTLSKASTSPSLNGYETSMPTSTLSIRLSPDFRLGPSASLHWISEWLSQGYEDTIRNEQTTTPRRLLRLCVTGRVVLVEYEDRNDVVPPYVALSHRWGQLQHITTRRSNLERLRQGVKLTELPTSFREALFFAKLLGYTHMWIDALCIVQDSEQDWFNESQKMGSIFKHASVTFAIQSARDASEGFLYRSLRKGLAAHVQVEGHHFGVCRQIDYEAEIEGSLLSRRAWVLQERLLSTRTIHFVRDNIFLESEQEVRSELDCCKLGAALRQHHFGPYDSRLKTALNEYLSLHSTRTSASAARITSKAWFRIVERYSSCKLTKSADKLMAIAGMARQVQSKTGETWCAGIWANQLCGGLLWLRADLNVHEVASDRAPTWSWASQNGTVQHLQYVCYLEPRCLFIAVRDGNGASTWLDGPGQLQIRGCMIPFHYTGLRSNVVLGYHKARLQLEQGFPPREFTRFWQPVYATFFEIGEARNVFGWIALDEPHKTPWYQEAIGPTDTKDSNCTTSPESNTRLRFLIVTTYDTWGRGDFEDSKEVRGADQDVFCAGLLLEPSKRGNGSFRRVGAGLLLWSYIQAASATLDQSGSEKDVSSEQSSWGDYSPLKRIEDHKQWKAHVDKFFEDKGLTTISIE